MCESGHLVYSGKYALAEQAALLYARTPEGRADAERRLSREAALALAASEGLELERSDCASGFRYVSQHPNGKFQVVIKRRNLGSFDCAEAGALCLARHLRRGSLDA